MGDLELSRFESNIALDIASTTVHCPVHLSWTYEKIQTLTLLIPGATSRSSCTFWALRYWPKMHQNSARTDLGCTELSTVSQSPLESLELPAFLPFFPQ